MDMWRWYGAKYGFIASWLARRGSPATIVDVGCGDGQHLPKMKRELAAHGISLQTIGIDYDDRIDANADVFINTYGWEADIRMIADAVSMHGAGIGHGDFAPTELDFRNMYHSCAKFLKPDGAFFMGQSCSTGMSIIVMMSRKELEWHAYNCFWTYGQKEWPCKCGKAFKYVRFWSTKYPKT